MRVTTQPPEPQEDEIQITISKEEARALAAIVGSNKVSVRDIWNTTFLGMYGYAFDNYIDFSKKLYNKLRNFV